MPLVNAIWKRRTIQLLPALVLALCVAWGASASAQSSAPTRQLFQAVEVNDMNAVKTALAAGADLAAKNPDGKTAADVAVDKGHFIIAHFLLSERSSKNTAKRQTTRPSVNPVDRLRKPTPPPATTLAKQNQAAPPPAVQPVKPAPARPDTATRVTEQLAPAVRQPKPDTGLKSASLSKYGVPPRRPPAPARKPAPMAPEIAVAASPGVEQPDGREPLAPLAPSEQPPTVIRGEPAAKPAVPATGTAAVEASRDRASVAAVDKPSPGPVAAVGNFFKSIVDFVNPLSDRKVAEQQEQPATAGAGPSPASPAKPKRELAKAQPPAAQPQAEMAETDDLMEGDQIEAITDAAVEGLESPPDNSADLADALSPADADATSDLGDLLGPSEDVPASSASERTLDRIKGLLGEAPKEDEFGLPVVDLPTRERVDQADAADSFLDRLAESPEAPGGFLDDRPGPETGPGRQPIDEARDQIPVSDALQARLRRLGDAVTRDVTVDTREILRQG